MRQVRTAQGYGFGAAERLLSEALWERARRQDVVIATKGGLRMEGDRLLRDADARRPSQLEGTAPAADVQLSESDLKETDEILADAVPAWGPHPEGM
jgi:aryl-alcohol dehydrogenase-like predicted oxidoreductase